MAAAGVAFAAAAATLVGLTFGIVLLVATAQEATVERLQASAPLIKRWGGALLLVIGTWTFVLGLFAEAFAEVFAV